MTQTTNTFNKTRLAVYTVLVGQKESLNDPLQIISDRSDTDLEIDFYCFTDNFQNESNSWQFRNFSHPLVPAEKASRLPKACPDRYFPDYEYSLYIDNTVVFKRLPIFKDINGSIFKGYRHPWRNCPTDEADIVVQSGLDDSVTITTQMQFYEQQRHISRLKHLTAGTVLLRKHNDQSVIKFGCLWWEQILLFSKRDQLSIDLCAQEAGCPVEYFSGDKVNNDLFLWPVITNGTRVLGSFDPDYYAWKNRGIPEARSNPKKHYLENESDGAKKYNKKISFFDYACNKSYSSMGKIFSPRRGIAEIIEKNLIEEIKPTKILIIGIKSNNSGSVDPSELTTAENAFKQYFRMEEEPYIISSMIEEAEVIDNAPFQEAFQMRNYDLVITIGMTKFCIKNALAKFIKLLSNEGSLITGFCDSLSMQEVLNMHAEVSYRGQLQIFHGYHVSVPTIIASSIFIFKNNSSKK